MRSYLKKLRLLGLYFNTARHLTYEQLFYQLYFRLKKKKVRQVCFEGSKFKNLDCKSGSLSDRVSQDQPKFLQGEFTFLSKTDVIGAPSTWDLSNLDGLWLDQLFYLRYINQRGVNSNGTKDIVYWLHQWDANISRYESKAFWPPFNASERLFSVGKFYLCNKHDLLQADKNLILKVMTRDFVHVLHNMELHLSGNHYFKNACSLLWYDSLIEYNSPSPYRDKIIKHLSKALSTQILSDGLHYELSPGYHTLMLADLYDVFLVLDSSHILYNKIKEKLQLMAGALDFLLSFGDIIPVFNDTSKSLSHDPISLLVSIRDNIDYTIPSHLAAAGYYKLDKTKNLSVVADCGDLGPRNLLAHAHADMLSFELYSHGRKILSSVGCSTYYEEPFRQYERSTCAHNTVSVNDCSQAEMWSSFRVAKRGNIKNCNYYSDSTVQTLSASHDAFSTRKNLITHKRIFESKKSSLRITDSIDSKTKVRWKSYLHVVAGVDVIIDGEKIKLIKNGMTLLKVDVRGAKVSVVEDYMAADINVRDKSKSIIISPSGLCSRLDMLFN